MKNDCLFCAIVDGEIPSSKVYEDEQCYAFYDIAPQAPTHFLVVPKEHICCANAITADNSAVVAHCFEVIVRICKDLGVDSYRIVNNCGDQAGQTVKHLHFHVLAGRDMTWPPGYKRKKHPPAGGCFLQLVKKSPARDFFDCAFRQAF